VADERVEAAVANWAPRFVSQGVDANDFRRVTSRVAAWPDWLPAWVANGDMHAQRAREAERQGRTLTAGEAWNHAALSYHFAKFVWMIDTDRYRSAADQAVAALREVHRLLDPAAERLEIPFEGATMFANLRRPQGAAGGQCHPAAITGPAERRVTSIWVSPQTLKHSVASDRLHPIDVGD